MRRAKPSKHPGEGRRVRPHRAAPVQPDVRDPRRPGGGRGLGGLPAARRPRRASSSTSRTSLQFARKKPPFGIAQIGKSFRNEITPANFIFRTREFEQMEMEFFVPPAEAERVVRALDRARGALVRPTSASGPTTCGSAPTTPTSSRTTRRRRATSSTCSRSAGRSSRGSPTAATSTSPSTPSSPARSSSTSTRRTKERYVPHVIEPAAGADRATLAFLVDAYDVEEVEGRQRTVLRLHPRLAPVKVAVLPLVSKEGMPEKAREVFDGAARPDPGRVRRGRLDRQALPPPGRDRHPVGRHRRRPDDGGRHGHPARPRLARAGAGADRGPGRRARRPPRRSPGGARSSPEQGRAALRFRGEVAELRVALLAGGYQLARIVPAELSPRGRRPSPSRRPRGRPAGPSRTGASRKSQSLPWPPCEMMRGRADPRSERRRAGR